MIKMFETIHKMNSTHRYSNVHLSERENILEHTGSVVLMCVSMLTRYQNDVLKELDNKLVADTLTKAAIHDIEETVLGDVVRPLKYHSPESIKLFKTIEIDSAKSALNDLSTPELYPMWESDKDGLSGHFIMVADTISVVYKLYSECVRNGVYSILSTCTSLVDYLVDIDDKLKSIYVNGNLTTDADNSTYEFFSAYINDAIELISKINKHAPTIHLDLE